MTRALLVLVAVAIAAGGPVYAHHSFAAFYFESETMTVEGEIQEFQYRNPHAWVYVMAPDEKGQMQRFGAEWGGPGRLSRQGIQADTLKPGDRVIITGAPGREPEKRVLHLKSIRRASDGWTWGGNRGRR